MVVEFLDITSTEAVEFKGMKAIKVNCRCCSVILFLYLPSDKRLLIHTNLCRRILVFEVLHNANQAQLATQFLLPHACHVS